jgi:hypothetical protein
VYVRFHSLLRHRVNTLPWARAPLSPEVGPNSVLDCFSGACRCPPVFSGRGEPPGGLLSGARRLRTGQRVHRQASGQASGGSRQPDRPPQHAHPIQPAPAVPAQLAGRGGASGSDATSGGSCTAFCTRDPGTSSSCSTSSGRTLERSRWPRLRWRRHARGTSEREWTPPRVVRRGPQGTTHLDGLDGVLSELVRSPREVKG